MIFFYLLVVVVLYYCSVRRLILFALLPSQLRVKVVIINALEATKSYFCSLIEKFNPRATL